MAFLLNLLALAPLIYSGAVISSYTSDKELFIRFVVALVAVLYCIFLFASRRFRERAVLRLRRLRHNHIVIAVGAYFAFYFLSVGLAVDKYRAFLGTFEDGEGFVGMAFLLSFFLFAALLFQRREWLWFFRSTLAVAGVLFIGALVQVFQGEARPYFLMGNPAYLATYFLFAVLAAAIIWFAGKRYNSGIWTSISPAIAITSISGIFLTKTRGALVGLLVGVMGVLVYIVFFADHHRASASLRRGTAVFFAAFLVSGGIFFMTRGNNFWQNIPGLDRLARTYSQDLNSTSARFVSARAAFRSINPLENGYKKFLFGWGQENYVIASNTHYDPVSYLTVQASFDRAHNKLLDVLVMNGLLGLIAYCAIWFFVFRFLFSDRIESLFLQGSLIFFGAAYLVQNLFVFDTSTSYLAFFAFLAFVIWLANQEVRRKNPAGAETSAGGQEEAGWLVTLFFGMLAIFLSLAFIFWTVAPYVQMKMYLDDMHENRIDHLLTADFIFSPFTYAQTFIRKDFIVHAYYLPPSQLNRPVLEKAIAEMEDLLAREAFNSLHYIFLARAYAAAAKISNRGENLIKAEANFKKAKELSPKNQEIYFAYGIFLLNQKRESEALEVLHEALVFEPRVPFSNFYYGLAEMTAGEDQYAEALDHTEFFFTSDFRDYLSDADAAWAKGSYVKMLRFFYEKKDTARVLLITERLQMLDTAQAAAYGTIAGTIRKMGSLPLIQFER